MREPWYAIRFGSLEDANLRMHLGWNQVFNHVADVKKQWLEEKRVASPFISPSCMNICRRCGSRISRVRQVESYMNRESHGVGKPWGRKAIGSNLELDS